MPRFSAFRSRLALAAALALLALAPPALAQDDDPTLTPVPASDYQPITGQPFFLLTDASYGSDETAQVRLEAPDDWSLRDYAGADILVYRIPDPLGFLKAQSNLHRIEVKPDYRGEGLANTLSYLWDSWFRQTRRSWQRVLSGEARGKVVAEAPEFSAAAGMHSPTRYTHAPQYAPLPGLPLVDRFRYPLWDAQPIQPPADTAISGSSSNFLAVAPGNVMIPVGKLAPGLYLVEAVIGRWRANTLLFVTDTVAVTKSSAAGMLAWSAERRSGKPVAGTELVWTDGLGVLRSGHTGADGTLALEHASPEHSYLIGRDPAGGVFVAENYYYDSEIYNTKLYAFTDRPLYRPGDRVQVKFIGRAFQSADRSTPAAAGPITLQVLDPNGAPVASQSTRLDSAAGAALAFTLPANAQAGGYTLAFDYQGERYGGAFRVAEYVKPHFNPMLVLNKDDYATGEEIAGHIQINYADGKPVANARVSVSVRAQQVSMVEGELRYAGLFPLKLDQQELVTDARGRAALTLPPASEPSRYVVTLLATDGAAWRVRVTRELLIARGVTPWRLSAPGALSDPGQEVTFHLAAGALPAAVDATAPAPVARGQHPASWSLIRLEDQSVEHGMLPAPNADGTLDFSLTPRQPGSYTLQVKDARGNLLAAASHWVAGAGISATPGSVRIVLDRPRYHEGESAEALVTFPTPVADALLTLERDGVERRALLSGGADWLRIERLSPTQYRLRIPVGREFSPNITLSVLYVQDGDYAFENAGILVARPQIALAVTPDKAVYRPGEEVELDLSATLDGQPARAHLTVSVVDEMVYVLQPEIAPSIVDFFYHPRRDNVRTVASLNFINYDMAQPALPGAPPAGRWNERGVKVLERPRRDEQDTAAWAPDLVTAADGHVHLRFRMPDSLTRWRITVRAVDAAGVVGQTTANIRSEQPLYLKWTSPTHFRAGDQPRLDLVAFNQQPDAVKATLKVVGAGLALERELTLERGPNTLQLPLDQLASGEVRASLEVAGQRMDSLATRLTVEAADWRAPRQINLPVATSGVTALALPADAGRIRLRFVAGAQGQLARVADDLVSYPYGCVEQTASRLLPLALALALDSYRGGDPTQGLPARLRTERQRLALLAGNGGVFGWWGEGTGNDPFLTAWAYYADFRASQALQLALPAENWQQVLVSYREAGEQPVLAAALELWWAARMGLPVATQLDGLAARIAPDGTPATLARGDSLPFVAPASLTAQQAAGVLVAHTYRTLGKPLPAALSAQLPALREALADHASPLLRSLLLLSAPGPVDHAQAEALLATISPDQPTLDRALALDWIADALGATPGAPALSPADIGPGRWRVAPGADGAREWIWDGATPPATLRIAGNVGSGLAPEAILDFESREDAVEKLPIGISRKLYRLVATDAAGADADTSHWRAVALAPGEAVDANSLYVDELTLAAGEHTYRYGLLEAPLPPGASVETSTWGMDIDGLDGQGAAGRALRQVEHEMGELAYHQPVLKLTGRQVYRQLLRFGLPGRFVLPPARFFRMYQPEAKAFADPALTTLTVE